MIKENIVVNNFISEPAVTYEIRCKLLEWAKEQSTTIIASRIEAQGYDYVNPADTIFPGEYDNIFMYADAELVFTDPVDIQTLNSTFSSFGKIKANSPESELSQLMCDVPEIAEVEVTKHSKSDEYYYAYFTNLNSFIQIYPARLYFEPYGLPATLKVSQLLEDKRDLEGFNSIDIYRNWLPHDKQNSISYPK